jgi:hypothetical protein
MISLFDCSAALITWLTQLFYHFTTLTALLFGAQVGGAGGRRAGVDR